MILCPVCNSRDFVRFAFVEHSDSDGELHTANPTDFDSIYVCPMLHVFVLDKNSKECELLKASQIP